MSKFGFISGAGDARLNTILVWVIAIGSIVLVAEVSYLVYRATNDEAAPASPAPPQGRTAASLVGVRFPDRLVPRETRVVGVIFTHCTGGCEGNVPIWNTLSAVGVRVVAVTRALATDAKLFRDRTGAQFPVTAFEGDDFLRQFDGSGLGWTLILDDDRVVVHAIKGQLREADIVLRRLPGR